MPNYIVTRQPETFRLLGAELFIDPSEFSLSEHNYERLAVDTETTGFDFTQDKVFSIQIGAGQDNFIVDMNSVSFAEVVTWLKGRQMVLHNAKFDLPFLMRMGLFPHVMGVRDTFIQEKCITLGKFTPLDLGYVTKKYIGIKRDKSIQSTIHHGFRSIHDLQYAWEDTEHLVRISDMQYEQNQKQTMDFNINNSFCVVLSYIEFCGIKLDRNKWLDKMSRDKEKMLAALDELNTYCKENGVGLSKQIDLFSNEQEVGINWDSPMQVSELFEDRGIDLYFKGKKTINKEVLKKRAGDDSLVRKYISYKVTVKDCSTYGDKFLKAISPVTHRIHTSFNQLVSTGRMSSGRRKENKFGIDKPNLQNIPKGGDARDCFVPEEGNVFIISDYASQESRILADMTQDPALLEFFASGGGDMHSYVARLVWPDQCGHLSLDEVKEQFPDLRQKAKSVNFAIAYGGTGATIAENAGVTLDEGEEIYDSYMSVFKGVQKFFDVNLKRTLINGHIVINEKTNSRTFPLWKPYEENDIDMDDIEDSYRKGMVDAVAFYKELEAEVESESFRKEYRMHRSSKSELFMKELKPKQREYDRLRASLNRLSTNYLIQGTAALQTKLAGVYLYRELRNKNLLGVVKIVNVIHDEYVVECPAEMAEEVKDMVVMAMEMGANKFMHSVEMRAEAHVDTKWSK